MRNENVFVSEKRNKQSRKFYYTFYTFIKLQKNKIPVLKGGVFNEMQKSSLLNIYFIRHTISTAQEARTCQFRNGVFYSLCFSNSHCTLITIYSYLALTFYFNISVHGKCGSYSLTLGNGQRNYHLTRPNTAYFLLTK